ncbi:putative RNA-directed DNA polymerase from transposon BS [Araneus ventricosus]|uniref:Putative RNA-directed DNA polymerase from transposon BS n=1 Tax=Araneus ventricosus TaxID=182803 RepID=A0A4Y2MAU0_ARAVE|nr:putative RNA-directed DNA polymerase from transposon BS [Araneus ventricosus]
MHKPGKDPHNPTSYRPISLLSSLSKVAEKIILNRLKPTIEDKLIPYQFGFKRNHSTIAQLLRMTETIRHGWSEGKDTGAVFLDVAKAFDKVWPNGFIYKLMKMGVLDSLTRLIASYLKNRSFQVRVGEALSKPIPIHAGVAQGSILAPFCFNVYVNDITRSKRTQLYLFADDTAILSTSSDPNIIATDLQTHLDELEEWLVKWKMKPTGGTWPSGPRRTPHPIVSSRSTPVCHGISQSSPRRHASNKNSHLQQLQRQYTDRHGRYFVRIGGSPPSGGGNSLEYVGIFHGIKCLCNTQGHAGHRQRVGETDDINLGDQAQYCHPLMGFCPTR